MQLDLYVTPDRSITTLAEACALLYEKDYVISNRARAFMRQSSAAYMPHTPFSVHATRIDWRCALETNYCALRHIGLRTLSYVEALHIALKDMQLRPNTLYVFATQPVELTCEAEEYTDTYLLCTSAEHTATGESVCGSIRYA